MIRRQTGLQELHINSTGALKQLVAEADTLKWIYPIANHRQIQGVKRPQPKPWTGCGGWGRTSRARAIMNSWSPVRGLPDYIKTAFQKVKTKYPLNDKPGGEIKTKLGD